MPRKAKEMSATEIRKLKHPSSGSNYIVTVGGVNGLQLQITPSNSKSWVLRMTINSQRRQMGLGSYPEVTLAQARERARQIKERIWNGENPLEHKSTLTFKDAMDKALAAKIGEFRNEKHIKQWRATLDAYATPLLGDKPVDKIQVTDILKVLEPIWISKNETASRVRGRIESVLAWATVSGYREGDNPARWQGNLDAVLPKVSKVKHHPALSLKDAPQWMADLKQREGIATRALEFLAMTAARSGEVRGATWSEIDFENNLWIIPAERMKAQKEHRVPLTTEMVGLLKNMPKFQDCEFIFPAARGGMLSDMALSACMKRINKAREGGYIDARSGRPAVPHGLRSTFRDWGAEITGYDRDMVEMALAHTVSNKVERAYRRGDMLEKRRDMMKNWIKFLNGEAK